jgi:3-methyladenine DNA glycosylase AlkD
MNTCSTIFEDLEKLADARYKNLQSSLLPTIPKEAILGVRIPDLRKYAKSIQNTPLSKEFLEDLPHFYYEENNLHAFLIADLKGKALYKALDAFLPYVDNWATCDGLRPKYFKKDKVRLRAHIKRWLRSPHLYTRRFAIEMLMLHFLDENDTLGEDLASLSSVESDEYYEQMMLAWYFAEALCQHFDRVLPYFTEGRLKDPVLKMARRKALDSLKLTREQKNKLN